MCFTYGRVRERVLCYYSVKRIMIWNKKNLFAYAAGIQKSTGWRRRRRDGAKGYGRNAGSDRAAAAGRTDAAEQRRLRVPAGSTPSEGRGVRRTESREPRPQPPRATRSPQAQERHEIHRRQTDTARQKVMN